MMIGCNISFVLIDVILILLNDVRKYRCVSINCSKALGSLRGGELRAASAGPGSADSAELER
jgi:hypothetical protein